MLVACTTCTTCLVVDWVFCELGLRTDWTVGRFEIRSASEGSHENSLYQVTCFLFLRVISLSSSNSAHAGDRFSWPWGTFLGSIAFAGEECEEILELDHVE